MGLFSSSKSKSSSNVNTTTQNAGFSDIQGPAVSAQGSTASSGSGNITLGLSGGGSKSKTYQTVNVSSLDGGAIESAFSFAKDFSEQTNATNSAALTESIKSVTESARSETENTMVQLKTLGIYALAAWAAISVFKAAK